MGPRNRFGGLNITYLQIIISFLICFLPDLSENQIFFFFFSEAKTQLQEQLVNLTTDIVLVATGAVSFSF